MLFSGRGKSSLDSRLRATRMDDAAPQELACSRLGAEKLAGQIDGKDLVPLFQSHVGKSGIALQAGIVDQNVDRAKLAYGAAEPFLSGQKLVIGHWAILSEISEDAKIR
jgi:hypothetical protein